MQSDGFHRHFASIDTQFEIPVWDVERTSVMTRFVHPPDLAYVGNVGLALSDDARLAASAGSRDVVL